jgi:hypothetical protein
MVIMLLALTAFFSWILYTWANASSAYKQAQIRARLSVGWRKAQKRARQSLQYPELKRLLKQAGIPIGPTGFLAFRLSLVLLVGLFFWPNWFYGTVGILVIWVLTEPRKPFPMAFLLVWLRRFYSQQLSSDVFLLYELIKQYLEVFHTQPRNLYDILTRVSPLVPRLTRPLNLCLSRWNQGPQIALDMFAEDIGNTPAKELAETLAEIAASNPAVALDVLLQKQTDFRNERIRIFQRRLYLRGLIGTTIAMIGIISILLDFQTINQIYTQYLMKF